MALVEPLRRHEHFRKVCENPSVAVCSWSPAPTKLVLFPGPASSRANLKLRKTKLKVKNVKDRDDTFLFK